MPSLYHLPEKLNGHQLHLIFAQSLNLAESGMLGMNFGRFSIDRLNLGVGFVLFALGFTFWFISCYTLSLLVLNIRGDTMYQNSVHQLVTFLKSERVENSIIERVVEHFRYCWIRTKGVNLQQLTNERIGAVFGQDLSYNFYKKTFTILDSIIGGGEIVQRQLASVSAVAYYLPNHDIFREMDVCRYICIVHRGRVNVFKNGKKIIILTKGDVFGQLEGVKVRPVRVTAVAENHVDLLLIEISAFQTIITDEMRYKISKSRQAKNNFMATKNVFIENPYDSVPYLLRGRKTIILPSHNVPIEAIDGSWYSRWLYLVWLISPFFSSITVFITAALHSGSQSSERLLKLLAITDIIGWVNFVAEFYSAELIVARNKLAYRRFGVKKFRDWTMQISGKCIVREGDTFNTTYFIHQGEVEKWMTDAKTFSILDTIIKGGEAMQRQLASVSTQAFFLGGHDIIRENDLVTYLCVVHRGKVILTKKNRKLIVLTKGDIFGQLLGTRKRPIRVTATAEDKVDVLYIEIDAFQSIITEEWNDFPVEEGKFPIPIRDMRDMVRTIDFSQWTHPDDRGEGKCIVREGDTFNITYFIHEGEVEKWYIDKS
ncbi:unnamed protein product [Spodoptera littoralis]|uniref:Cyclic nucleotide-binding domain-containing protein n=1 Tax=Spodoptera littoralis TaxID=7109 RepID=A0A9P0I241_SPOLI|nr:unnamed protein product [Spodoptera littoralis]CAH1638086.1 unnamed protein product [Spodoptera littoralis]